MGRWSNYGKLDSQVATDGDPIFKGINMLLDRSELPPGYLARCENKRLRNGLAETRPGTSEAADFNPPFANRIIGSGIYSNPNGEEVMLVATADENYIVQLQFGKDAVPIYLQAPETTGLGGVEFVQAFDKVLMLRTPDPTPGTPPLIWDGNTANRFAPVTATPPTGFAIIPNAWHGIGFQNRILLFSAYLVTVPQRDQVLMTKVLDYSVYDTVWGDFRINAGQSDFITAVLPYFDGAIVIFKFGSIHMLENFTGDPNLSRQRMLSSRLGSVGVHCPLQIGSDGLFLSQPGGIYRVSEVIENQITTQPAPVSDTIRPVIDRINWGVAHRWACSAFLDDRAYFTLPLDGVTDGCNAIVVFNTVSKEWESAPDWWDTDKFRINRLHVTYNDYAKRLFALDYNAAKIYLLYDGFEDQIGEDILPVRDLIETRGYVAGDPGGFKRFQRVNIGIRTFEPAALVTAISDGFNEEKELASITKDRLKFYLHGHPDYVDDGSQDPDQPKRKDYATNPNYNVAIEDFEGLPDGEIDFLPPTSITFSGDKQQSLERFQIRQNGRWVSIRIENVNGQCDILGVSVDAIPAQESVHTVA
jgi:hypothetical protein